MEKIKSFRYCLGILTLTILSMSTAFTFGVYFLIAIFLDDSLEFFYAEISGNTFQLNLFLYAPFAILWTVLINLLQLSFCRLFKRGMTLKDLLTLKIENFSFLTNPIMFFILFVLSVSGVEGNVFAFIVAPLILILIMLELVQSISFFSFLFKKNEL